MPGSRPTADRMVEGATKGDDMMCHRCGEPIRTGEKFTTYTKDSASGAGGAVTLHLELCKRPPTQTYPAGPRRR